MVNTTAGCIVCYVIFSPHSVNLNAMDVNLNNHISLKQQSTELVLN